MRTWLIIGGGVSGLGAAKWLRKRGDAVRVSDGKPLKQDAAQAFAALGVDVRDGGHDLSHLDGVDAVVLSPGLPATHPLVVAAAARGLPATSEIDLALQSYRGQVVAVTGTNGKSTTCAMIGRILAGAGRRVAVGGNYGDPPTAMLAEDRAGDVLVLELSSYQLEQSRLVAPAAAVFTSFSYDHLARHGSMANYLRAKWRVFDAMAPAATAVVPDYIVQAGRAEGLTIPARLVTVHQSGAALRASAGAGFCIEDGCLVFDTGERVDVAAVGIRESQNHLNAGFALVACAAVLGASVASLAPHLRGFRGLPHRCELVGTFRGVSVIDDSKSTNVESTLVALASQPKPVLLMMGGQGKGEPYGPILDEAARVAAVVTFGASGGEIAAALKPRLRVHEFKTLADALGAIGGLLAADLRPVLFSPGCASFDEFDNYEHRGRVFQERMKAAGMTPADHG